MECPGEFQHGRRRNTRLKKPLKQAVVVALENHPRLTPLLTGEQMVDHAFAVRATVHQITHMDNLIVGNRTRFSIRINIVMGF